MQADLDSSFRASGVDRRSSATGRRALAVLFALGALVFTPALRSPYLLDDYVQASMIAKTFPVERGPFDLYNFVDGAARAILVERGTLPWWSSPKLQIRFLRPLSSALLWADHRLFGSALLALHLHSFLWWIAAVLAARALFRRVLQPRAALLATIAFALAPCHAIPIAWLANREALVSLTFGTLALAAYARWRDGHDPRDAALATVGFALALLGGEYALCFGGYVLAIEIVTRGQAFARRARGIAPFAIPTGAYLAAHVALGYGSAGSGFYTDPLRDPGLFLRIAPWRAGVLFADGWLTLDNETLTGATPHWQIALIAAATAAVLALLLRRLLPRLATAERRSAAWLLGGSLLALAPVLAVLPSPRLVGVSALGIAALVGLLLDHAWFIAGRPTELAGYVALALGFLHFVHGPVTSFLMGRQLQKNATDFLRAAGEVRARIADPRSADFVVVRGFGGSFFLPFALVDGGLPPAHWRILAHTGHALAVRQDARTLDLLVAPDQAMFAAGEGNLFLDQHARFTPGQIVEVGTMRATVLEVGPLGPRRVRYQFDSELEAAPRVWLQERADVFADAELPNPGFGKPFDP